MDVNIKQDFIFSKVLAEIDTKVDPVNKSRTADNSYSDSTSASISIKNKNMKNTSTSKKPISDIIGAPIIKNKESLEDSRSFVNKTINLTKDYKETKDKAIISAKSSDIVVGEDLVVDVNLVNKNNAPLIMENVVVLVDNNEFKGITDENGLVKFSIPNLDINTYEITCLLDNSDFIETKDTITVSVIKKQSELLSDSYDFSDSLDFESIINDNSLDILVEGIANYGSIIYDDMSIIYCDGKKYTLDINQSNIVFTSINDLKPYKFIITYVPNCKNYIKNNNFIFNLICDDDSKVLFKSAALSFAKVTYSLNEFKDNNNISFAGEQDAYIAGKKIISTENTVEFVYTVFVANNCSSVIGDEFLINENCVEIVADNSLSISGTKNQLVYGRKFVNTSKNNQNYYLSSENTSELNYNNYSIYDDYSNNFNNDCYLNNESNSLEKSTVSMKRNGILDLINIPISNLIMEEVR